MRIVILCDEEDSTVGHFVGLCAQSTLEFVSDIGIDVVSVNAIDLTDVNVMKIANQYENQPFICVAYSHGSESSLICSRYGNYISNEVNFDSFQNTLFYTWACSSAGLGEVLVKNGCHSYVGYWEPVSIPSPGDPLTDVFVECATFALRAFYLEELTILESVNAMKDKIDEMWKELVDENPIAATYLLDHSNFLDLIGKENLRRADIFQE